VVKNADELQMLRLPGTLLGFSQAPIAARASGYIKRWNKDIGSLVQEGEVLAEIDTPELDQLLSQLVATQQQASESMLLAKSSLERWDALRKKDVVSQQEYEEKKSIYSQAVANYNAAAQACASSGARIFVMAQSDVYPPHGWDEQIVQAMKPHMDEPTVLHLSDGFRTDQIMTIMCYNWRWWLGRDWLLCPEYDGYFSDTEFSLRAYADKVVQDAKHIKFYHDHPLFTGAASDDTYMRQQNPEACARGKAIFELRNPQFDSSR